MYFPVADLEITPLVPIIIGLAVSLVSSPTGVSGGFLILPISINGFGFASPAVSPTNFIFNIVSTPLGLYRLYREKRLMVGLGILLMVGCLPGILIGTVLRCVWLKETADFKLFVAAVMAILAVGLVRDICHADAVAYKAERNFLHHGGDTNLNIRYGFKTISYEFGDGLFSLSTIKLLVVALGVGLIGGIYGIGGGAIIAPLLVSVFHMPVYLVNGASLLASWGGAVFGLFSYAVFWPLFSGQAPVIPDVRLGLMFGLGGVLGVYAGSALQRYLPPKPLKIVMLVLIITVIVQNTAILK